jgi:hypothetical protein
MGNSLLKSNPFLREPEARRAALRTSAASSSAVEGICMPFTRTAKPVMRAAAERKTAKSGV